MEAHVIEKIEINNLWGRYDFCWDAIRPDVNILVGINGSGKTTFFNIMNALFTEDAKTLKHYQVDIRIHSLSHEISFVDGVFKMSDDGFFVRFEKISTFDVPLRNRRKLSQDDSPLFSELKDIVYKSGENTNSFTDYRLKATNFPERAIEINDNIKLLFAQINELFEGTGKVIEIDPFTNKLVFRSSRTVVQLNELSSGEKQILLILFKVFLMERKPFLLLMDEPEISLHIEWQYKLIKVIRELNPNCQLILSTHSPSIFGKGWGDRLTFIDELLTEHK
jgi:predicted ATP-dependent endonuclease of OLD family